MYDKLNFEKILNIRIKKLQDKYNISFDTLNESPIQYDFGTKTYLDEKGEKYIYCSFSGGNWYRDINDPDRLKIIEDYSKN